ncbi:MAG: hypothetical protein KME25_29900 [Symplocastrum torsivum CPER-KK1]|jgi:hypothetical protein|uniref:Uncharacterized protein n=1 Tax=Symplocastrum torsivum CPER-KK1 TaxID=450513 RepID=A0A951PTE2_9CYAN|nr:hypothetical protein [Symplocastrum torsivum CPER-KK1]
MDSNKLFECYAGGKRNLSEAYLSSTNLEQATFKRSQLYIDKRMPLPDWGTFFIEIGCHVAEWETGSNRLVIALAVPTRTCAAALAAFGVVLARANSSPNQVEIYEYFDKLCSLKKGTPIIYREGKKIRKGIYCGFSNENGQCLITVRLPTKNGDMICKVPPGEAQKVEPATSQDKRITLRTTGRCKFSGKAFIDACIGRIESFDFYKKSRLECVILGRSNILKQEIKEIPFGCCSSQRVYTEGRLQDVLRVREWLSDGQAYRSEVLSVDGSKPPRTQHGSIPSVTIFDGASGFLKWRDYWRNSHWIVVLDNTELHFMEAVYEINEGYRRSNRLSKVEIQNILSIPSGVELVIYQEERQ